MQCPRQDGLHTPVPAGSAAMSASTPDWNSSRYAAPPGVLGVGWLFVLYMIWNASH